MSNQPAPAPHHPAESKWRILALVLLPIVGILLVLLASTLLNVAYFAPVTYKAFFGKRPEGEETGIREAPLSMVVPILIAAGVSVFIGIYPDAIMSFVKVVTG